MERISAGDAREYIFAMVALLDGLETSLITLQDAKEMATLEETESKLPSLLELLNNYQGSIKQTADLTDELADFLMERGETGIAERAFELSRLATRAPDSFAIAWCRHRAWFRSNGYAEPGSNPVSAFAMPAEEFFQHVRSIISGSRKPRSDGASSELKRHALQYKHGNPKWTWKQVREELRRNYLNLIPKVHQDDSGYPADATMQSWKRDNERESN